ncbi:hypothetical protein ABT124_03465 [Streptomyces sp. NPDC001982]|uniref:hypothetical protein n=1 Tax=unclassified Streptomyces TaxID=2593676 RepID=UPI00332A5F72
MRVQDYDHAHDLNADNPRIDDLARRIAEATRERYGPDELPELDAASPSSCVPNPFSTAPV